MGGVPKNIGGVQTAAFHREPAWHGLGTVFQDDVTDYREMLKRANMLDLDVQKVDIPSIVSVPAERFSRPLVALTAKIPGTDDRRLLSTASPEYEVRQPEEIFSWVQFGPTDGATWETAFMMKEGTQIAGSIAFDREVVLDPNGVSDVVKTFLIVAASFDGSLANVARVTPTRVVCENTLNMALSNGKQGFSFKSTKNIRERVGLWQQSVVTVNTYMDAFETEAAALFAAPLKKDTFFNKVVPAIFTRPTEDKKGSFKKYDGRVETLASIWNGATSDGIRDTAWGALNTLTEANQWYRGTRKGSEENFLVAGAGFDGPTNTFRTHALTVVKEFAGIK